MKKFKEGDDVVITGKVIAIDKGGRYPLTVCVAENSEFMCTLEGKNHVDDTTISVFHLSDIQQSQFTDEELVEITETLKESNKGFILQSKYDSRELIIKKCNLMIANYEEKHLLELAEKLGYKVEKI